MGEVTWIPGGLIGKYAPPIPAGENSGPPAEEGVAVALRENGTMLLFAGKAGKPLRWVPTHEFAVDPKLVASADDVLEDLPPGDETLFETPQPAAPFGVRQRAPGTP